MFCYNVISVYCPVPYYSLWCKRYNGEKLAFNCLFSTKSLWAHRIFMRTKQMSSGGQAWPASGSHTPLLRGCCFSRSSSVFERGLLFHPQAVRDSVLLPLHSLHAIPKNQNLGILSEGRSDPFFLRGASYLPIMELCLVSMT